MAKAEDTWTVGEVKVNGMPVVYKFLSQLPNEEERAKLNWLTVISWKYDGSTNNGMPPQETNKSMIALEDSLETIVGDGQIYEMAYTATGNDLKEFVYYITDRDVFMTNFNEALSGHPRYPLEINFYEDPDWSDLSKLLADFSNAANK
ncbi:DUF695 domain-containing protein [Methylophaga nitratireducenticrescens]|uniref:DUF695 domain-containing protein n=1 Tax=Methylophaga nitratireducenticrescens TaxID=754476 RepID=UPI000CDC48C4|nr:DUF695 domain-containing protein [Methylophaga nitratireducenticrescens]AUZ85989.1 hypothetical protein CDW43_04560 [Methylophaga nitratireducenticrescens]